MSRKPIAVNLSALARQTGLALTTVRASIRNNGRSSLETARRIARALGVPLETYLDNVDRGRYVARGRPGRGIKGEVFRFRD